MINIIAIKDSIKKIREAVYGLEVRKYIADTMEMVSDHTVQTKEEIDEIIAENNAKIEELNEHYKEVITSGGDSVLEIVDARVPFDTLKEKLDDLEEKSLNIKDIKLGAVINSDEEEENRTLSVYDSEGEQVGIIDRDNSSFARMDIAELSCNNAILTQKAIDIYVNSATGEDGNTGEEAKPLKTIMEAVNRLDKYLLGNVYIKVQGGTYNESLIFDGFQGMGSLYLNLYGTTIINGEVYINSCTTAIRVNGDTETKAVINHTTTRQGAFTVYTSPYVFAQNLIINGNTNTRFTIEANQGAGLAIKSSTLNNSADSAIQAYECSNIYSINNIGSRHAKCSINSQSGSTICINGTIPNAPLDNAGTTGILHGTGTKTDSTGGSTPSVSKKANYKSTKHISYRQIDGWSRNLAYQGLFDKKNDLSKYNHYGAMVLEASKMKAELTGKTIEAVKLTIKRHAESQSASEPASMPVQIWGSTTQGTGAKPVLNKRYATISSLNKNQQITVTLPNTFIADLISQNLNSLVLYTSDGAGYLKLTDTVFNLEVTYK